MQHQATRTDQQTLDLLNELYEHEVAGVIRYLHYSFLIMGYSRIPIQKWFREQADEGIQHAVLVGEKITSLGGYPPVFSKQVEISARGNLDEILGEALEFEEQALAVYGRLAVHAAASNDIALEELARGQVASEQEHVDEVRKMLRRPG